MVNRENMFPFFASITEGKENSIKPFIVVDIGIKDSISIVNTEKYTIVPRTIDKDSVIFMMLFFNEDAKEKCVMLFFVLVCISLNGMSLLYFM